MLNEDASQAGSMGNSAPVARADVDTLPAGSYGPATGNAITGAGTSSGSAGADSAAAPAHIVSVQGAGGPTAEANGNFQANGQYGVLTMDAQGDFNYVRNPGTPDGVRDVFNYTLADASGASSSTTLTIDIGQIAAAAAGQNVINLPAGVQMSDIHVNGRDLVINMPDGTQMVIPNGAVFVPDLVIGDVQVPPTNLASLLIDSEPQPGAGQNQSSGGNFAEPVPPLDPGVPLGDLIPPTELTYNPPDFRPIGQFENTKPTVVIEPHDLAPGVVDAIDSVSEKGLPARDGNLPNEPAGTGEIADGNGTNDSDPSEHTFGQIVFTAQDGLGSITIDGVVITGTSVGTTITGQFGTMTITSVDLANGVIGYNYVLTDNNLLGDNSADRFAVVVTDRDGDVATATLTVDIIDDAPIARNDTDAVAKGTDSTDGNVLTGENTTSGSTGADTPGADNLVNNGDGVTGIHAGTSGSFASVTSGGTLVHGTFGDLVIHSDGTYTYTVTATNGTPGGNDVFTYQITDQDGDNATATLTITVPADAIPVPVNATALVDDDGLPLGNHDSAPGDDTQSPDPDSNESTWSGTLTANFGGDGPGTFSFSSDMNGKTGVTIGQETVTYHVVGDTLTAEVTASPDASRVGSDLFSVTINSDGTYSIQLLENVLQVNDGTNTENNATGSITFTATDADGDHANGTLTISFDDDIPTAIVPPPPEGGGTPPPLVSGQVDEDALATGNGDSAPGDDPGGASASGLAGSLDALFNAGADQPLSFSLSTDTSDLPSLTSNGHAVTYAVVGNVLTASADLNGDGHIGSGETIFTLTVNADGSWTFDLEGQLDHPTGAGTANDNTEDPNLFLDLSSIVVATDSDGDSATAAAGAFVITVDDDMPAQVAGSVTAHVDEDELPNGITDNDGQTTVATGSLAGQVSVGADQPGTFTLDASALGSLPALTSGGATVHYAIVGGELVAYTGNDSSTNHVFTVSLTSNGTYTVTLDAPIDHLPNSPANDDNQTLTLDLSGLVQVTDADGDSIHLDARSFLVQIEDDIPVATNTQITGTVDEDGIVGNASDGGDGNGIAGGPGDIAGTATTASGNVSGLFLSGADAPLTYSLSSTFTDLLAEGLTSKGVALSYNVAFDSNTHVYTLTATAGANTVFTFTVNADTGAYQFNLIDQLDHPTLNGLPGDNTENNLAIQLGSIIQATDADGDTVTANSGANTGLVINVNDDTPVARDDTDEITAGGSTATGNVITGSGTTSGSAGADSTGADAPISVVAISSVSHGTDTTFSSGVLSIAGDHGTLEMHADGSYTYTRTDNVGGVTDTFTYTIQDADGDTTTATLTIGIEDSIPVLATPPAANLDDDALAGGNAGGTGDDGPPNPGDADVASGTLVGTGGDGTLTYFFSGTQTGLPSGFSIEAGSTATTMYIDQLQGATEVRVLTITLNQATGAYTVTQNANILHPSLDGQAGDNTENNVSMNVAFFVQDADGDHSNTVNLNINIDDDTPTINVTKGDDSAVSLTTDDAQTIGVNTDTAQTTANFAGVFGLTFSAGADGTNTTPTLGYTLGVSSQGVLSGLSSHGSAIHLYLVGNEVIGSTSGSAPANDSDPSVVFTVTVNASGQVTLSQMQQIDHPLQAGANDAPFNDQSVSMADNLITLTASSSITDKDGDTATDSETVNIGANLHFTDDGPTAAIATTGQAISVDETPGVQADANDVAGPLAAFAGVTNVGTDPNMPAQYAANANAILTTTGTAYGADGPGTTVLSLNVSSAGVDSGLNTTDGHDILLFKEGDLIVGRVSGGADDGKAAFAISIDQTGHLSMVEYLSIQHPNTGSADESVSINNGAILGVVNVTDFDGDTASQSVAIGSLISFQDDGPTLGTVQSQQTDNNPATAPAVGTLHFSPGADGAGSTMTITADNTGIKSGGHALLTVQTGNVLTAYQDTNNDGIHQIGETTVVYTLTVNPDAGTSGQYVFDLVTPLDPTVTEVAIGGSSSFGAGPTLGQTLTDGATPTPAPLSVVSGYHPTASFDVSAWLAGTALSQSTVTSAGVNGSTSGWGVDNNNFETNNPLSQTNQELMYFDFGAQALSDPDGGGAFTPPSVSLPNITFAKFDFINYKSGAGNAGDDIAYVVHFTDGSFVSGFVPDANIDGTTWQFNAPAGKFIADISFYSGIEPDGTTTQSLGPGKIDLVSVGTTTSSLDVQPSFTVQLTDGDGDPTATAGFNVHIATGLTPFAPAAPVILDLNGDGVHLLGMDAGVHYDYGNGLVATAWASPQDGILAFDANHDGTVTSASEFVFGSNGTSDLQALSAFDTNHDGKLTAADAQFGSFVVWQDANSNGVADAGEVKSLAALGITGISLSSDGISYTTANGDATVVGTGSFTKADGSTGSLADAMFQTGALKAANDDVRSSTAVASNPALIGALAAAGLAALDAGVGNHASFRDFGNGTLDHSTFHTASLGSISTESMSVAETSHVQQSAVVSKVPVEPQHTGTVHDMVETAHALTATSTNDAHSITELLHGTTVPGQGGAATGAHMMAPVVSMPSAAQLAAALTHTGSAQPLNSVAGAQHDEVVGKVLADALHGGAAQGPNVDALLNAVTHGPAAGGNLGLETFASTGSSSVPFTHIPGAGAFGGFHSALTVEMVMHADAHPAAAHG